MEVRVSLLPFCLFPISFAAPACPPFSTHKYMLPVFISSCLQSSSSSSSLHHRLRSVILTSTSNNTACIHCITFAYYLLRLFKSYSTFNMNHELELVCFFFVFVCVCGCDAVCATITPWSIPTEFCNTAMSMLRGIGLKYMARQLRL